MMPLCWSVLLLCLSTNADIAVYRWEGESVTLKCSSEGCPVSVDESIGMYLNRQDWKGVEEVLYYHRRNGKITLQERFNSRIVTTGSLMNHTITISNLTMEDAGCYHCVYVNRNAVRFKCNGYTLVVRDDILVYGRVGGSITFKCSCEGCPGSVEEYTGLSLYRQVFQEKEEVLYYHRQTGNISPQKQFINRIETTGSLMNHTITISSLTMEDLGFYRCVYVKENDHRVHCKGYILIVRENPSVPPNQSPSLVLVIIATYAISSLVTVIFILMIQRTKQWIGSRRTTTRRASNNNVYEVMTRNALRPPAAPEQSPPSLIDFA
ncbi:uncharacterized protein LOC115568995 isoform X2 [Sparus aurata]|uniref:uncharacterized protein LOC115568995 isoform X2 n=1 Tax=Sparus aurata TaxID=8175 RepID=UPI0011C10B98|nr:uncharacterized protein LOC115568995 isoform X2 [Sparus aurata]